VAATVATRRELVALEVGPVANGQADQHVVSVGIDDPDQIPVVVPARDWLQAEVLGVLPEPGQLGVVGNPQGGLRRRGGR
jgi:hypothetical protein